MAVLIGMNPTGDFRGSFNESCDDFGESPVGEPSDTPKPPPVEGPLANIDPCSLLTDAVLAAVEPQPGARPPLRPGPPFTVLPMPAQTCFLSGMEWRGAGILVALNPESTSGGAANDLALAMLGVEVVQQELHGTRLWLNRCYTHDEPCTYGVVLSGPPYLVVVEFQNMGVMPDDIRLEYRAAYDQFIDALAATLAELPLR